MDLVSLCSVSLREALHGLAQDIPGDGYSTGCGCPGTKNEDTSAPSSGDIHIELPFCFCLGQLNPYDLRIQRGRCPEAGRKATTNYFVALTHPMVILVRLLSLTATPQYAFLGLSASIGKTAEAVVLFASAILYPARQLTHMTSIGPLNI